VTGTDTTSLVGQLLLGRYRVLRRIALGGMGAVYLARIEGARGFSKPVVIKRILPMWGGDEEIVSLFAREARILSQLQDPGIVSVLDFGQITDGTLVMVLDYVHGYHLAHWVAYLRAVEGGIPVDMALHIMLRVLSALHYAHTFVKSDGKPLEVVHRDVSPANILLDTSGHVKLVDFGIARAEGDSTEYKTEAPQLRGKFGYLAPELFTGEPPTPQSDVYAAGVVLYETLTGDNPFRGREVTDSYHKALTVDAPPLHTLRSDVSPELSKVVDTALAKEPSARYRSAAEFADQLRPYRSTTDEVCQAKLRAAVQIAFAGPLADVLGIEPLSASDEAWREAAADGGVPSLAAVVQDPDLQITRNVSSKPATKPGSLPPGQSDRAQSDATSDDPFDQPTLPRGSLQPPGAAVRPLYYRMGVAVVAAVLFGSGVVAGIVRMLDTKEDRVIVIERESSGDMPADALPSDSLPSAVLPDAAAASVASTPTAKLSAKSAPVPAVGPEPARLTSAFAREQSRIQHCFSAHAASNVSPGEITIEFQVASSGEVEKAELSPSALASSPLGTCLLGVAKVTRFPRLTRPVTFRIPIQARVTQP
jgi:eukaryotic-like serine/threonine-protein kinase